MEEIALSKGESAATPPTLVVGPCYAKSNGQLKYTICINQIKR